MSCRGLKPSRSICIFAFLRSRPRLSCPSLASLLPLTASLIQSNARIPPACFSYFCMPQPSASKAGVGTTHSTTDHRLMKIDASLDTDGDGSVSIAELVEGLKKAVESIPSYIERCTQMWVLVPACEHVDVEGAACDFFSWRSRGCASGTAASNARLLDGLHSLPAAVAACAFLEAIGSRLACPLRRVPNGSECIGFQLTLVLQPLLLCSQLTVATSNLRASDSLPRRSSRAARTWAEKDCEGVGSCQSETGTSGQ